MNGGESETPVLGVGWGLTEVRHSLCRWMAKAESRESSTGWTRETISFVENKDPERAKNW